LAPIITGTMAWRPAASAASGASTTSLPSRIGPANPLISLPCASAAISSGADAPSVSLPAGRARSAFNAAGPSEVMPCACA
jgi:hypothetical protein